MISLGPASKDLLYIKVADGIHQYIRDNQLKPGDRLPSERIFAEQLKIARNSVREALRILENQGIVEVQTGRGTFISSPAASDSLYIQLVKVSYYELFDIKTVLERETVCRLALSITPAQWEELDALLRPVEAAARQGVYSDEKDRLFHLRMMAFSDNKVMEQFAVRLMESIKDFGSHIEHCLDYFLETIPYHRAMLDAMKKRDVNAARAAYDRIIELDKRALDAASGKPE